jgi:hypothetical protein
MRKTMRLASLALASAMAGGLLLGVAPTALAQRVGGRVVIVGRGPFFGPYWGPYWSYYYGYPPYYVPANYGEVKIDTHLKNADVYIDGGFTASINQSKKFALPAGNHTIELRDHDGQTLDQENVAVTIGRTTKLHFS